MFGVCVHPRLGGWFAIRALLIFGGVTAGSEMVQPVPPDCVPSREGRIQLLEAFNFHWQVLGFVYARQNNWHTQKYRLSRELMDNLINITLNGLSYFKCWMYFLITRTGPLGISSRQSRPTLRNRGITFLLLLLSGFFCLRIGAFCQRRRMDRSRSQTHRSKWMDMVEKKGQTCTARQTWATDIGLSSWGFWWRIITHFPALWPQHDLIYSTDFYIFFDGTMSWKRSSTTQPQYTFLRIDAAALWAHLNLV